MAIHRELSPGAVYRAQGRILDMVADGDAVHGSLDRLAAECGLDPDTLRMCLREMVHAGWIAVQTHPFRRLTIRLELRTLGPRPVAVDRRRLQCDAWEL